MRRDEQRKRGVELRHHRLVFATAVADAATMLARRDKDAFDAICDHVLVIDHAAKPSLSGKQPVVGTYRLLRQDVAERHGGKVVPLDLEHRHVGLGIGADHLGLVGLAVVGRHLDLVGAVDDVIVGHDIAVGGDDEARALGLGEAARTLATHAGQAGNAILAEAALDILNTSAEVAEAPGGDLEG